MSVTPAKDIITLMMGFDSYGTPHVPQKILIEVVEKIREKQSNRKFAPWGNISIQPTDNEPEVFRIFNRKDYGYYRSDILNLAIQEEKNETINLKDIYIENLSSERKKAIRKSFNVEKQAIEAVELQQIISEDKISPYLQDKRYARDNFRMIAKVNKGDF